MTPRLIVERSLPEECCTTGRDLPVPPGGSAADPADAVAGGRARAASTQHREIAADEILPSGCTTSETMLFAPGLKVASIVPSAFSRASRLRDVCALPLPPSIENDPPTRIFLSFCSAAHRPGCYAGREPLVERAVSVETAQPVARRFFVVAAPGSRAAAADDELAVRLRVDCPDEPPDPD